MSGSATNQANRASTASRLLEVEQVTGLLQSLLPSDWSAAPGDVRIERCWPSADDGFIVEWSFSLGSDQRYSLYARSLDEATGVLPTAEEDASSMHRPTLTKWGLRGMLSRLPQYRLLVHTPDCDPAMPHLSKCLDEIGAAKLLAPFWESAAAEPSANGESPGAHCRLIGYKPGRRAAICYTRNSSDDKGQMILGKTFHKQQGEQLARLHCQINDEFSKTTDGVVRVSSPVVYVPELKLALFDWAPGEADGDGPSGLADSTAQAVRTIAALHGMTIEGLETFTVQDECAILTRWHQAVAGAHPRIASETAALLAMLLQQSEAIDTSTRCTIHRDFYETQFVTFGGMTTLLDLDTLCVGHPCLDLGNFLAHLYLRMLRRNGGQEQFDTLLNATTRSYEDIAGRLDLEALDFYLNSSLFRLGAVHAFRTQTHCFAEPIWHLARRRLERRAKGG